jgi:hypothetical protein
MSHTFRAMLRLIQVTTLRHAPLRRVSVSRHVRFPALKPVAHANAPVRRGAIERPGPAASPAGVVRWRVGARAADCKLRCLASTMVCNKTYQMRAKHVVIATAMKAGRPMKSGDEDSAPPLIARTGVMP